jgi:hypothetical protein
MTDFDLKALRLDPNEVLPGARSPGPRLEPEQRRRTARTALHQRLTGRFVIAKLEPLIEAASVLDSQLLVWLFLVYQAKISHRKTVEVTNAAVAEWGITRWLKYSGLAKLQEAGLVEVEQRGRRSPRVTILRPLD